MGGCQVRSQNDVFLVFFWCVVESQRAALLFNPQNGKMGIWCQNLERLMSAFELMAGICTCVNHKGSGSLAHPDCSPKLRHLELQAERRSEVRALHQHRALLLLHPGLGTEAGRATGAHGVAMHTVSRQV